MTNKAVVIVGCRVFGLYLLIDAILALPQVFRVLGSGLAGDFLFIVLPVALRIAFSAVLILLPSTFARLLLTGTSEDDRGSGSWSPDDLQRVLIGALGLLLILWTISDTQSLGQAVSGLVKFAYTSVDASVSERFSFVVTVFRLALGIGLVLGARGITDFFRRIRNAGH